MLPDCAGETRAERGRNEISHDRLLLTAALSGGMKRGSSTYQKTFSSNLLSVAPERQDSAFTIQRIKEFG
jgi:hypothetical protein